MQPRWQCSGVANTPVVDDRLSSSWRESLYAAQTLPLKKLPKHSYFLNIAIKTGELGGAVSCAMVGDKATNGTHTLRSRAGVASGILHNLLLGIAWMDFSSLRRCAMKRNFGHQQLNSVPSWSISLPFCVRNLEKLRKLNDDLQDKEGEIRQLVDHTMDSHGLV